ncbi:uncharacterized protein [Montipora capricornis]|uniref:uncharacterized protein n=1 Tax=Montipora capricornis TaxID=246305 RepID=UPI0035F1B9CE
MQVSNLFNPSPEKHVYSKPSFLKKAAALFNPLGFLSPYTVRAKVVLQEIWASGVVWDEPVSVNLSLKASRWFEEICALVKIRIPRCMRTPAAVKEVILHTFVDSFQEAYGAVSYFRHVYEDETISFRLGVSRSRVAPLQTISIPLLELIAAILGLKLSQTVGQKLGIKKEKWSFWSDRFDVLYWIRGQSWRSKPFVRNRVSEIQALTDPEQ